MEGEGVAVKTTNYEGPLSLLLSLVRKRKLFINDISLVEITDDFLREVNADRSLSQDAEFVDVSSTLLLLKSRSLLPDFFLSDEEEQSISDLEQRLRVYEIVERQQRVVAERWESDTLFTRRLPVPEPVFTPDDIITKKNLLVAIRGVRDSLPQKKLPTRVSVKQTVRLESVVDRIVRHIQKNTSSRFSSLVEGSKGKGEMALFFVALLELVKNGILEANQVGRGDITLERSQVTTPHYAQ